MESESHGDCHDSLQKWQDDENVELRNKFMSRNVSNAWNRNKKDCSVEKKNYTRKAIKADSLEKRVFECEASIKKLLMHKTVLVAVDVLNFVYVVKDIKLKSRTVLKIKLDYFNLTDMVIIDCKLVCVAKNTHIMKEIDLCRIFGNSGCKRQTSSSFKVCGRPDIHQGDVGRHTEVTYLDVDEKDNLVSDIRKDTGEYGYKRLLFCKSIYMLGESLYVLNKDSYEIMYRIHGKFCDVAAVDQKVYCLTFNGDIIVYEDKNIVKKLSLEDKFSFKRIIGGDAVYVLSSDSVKILDYELMAVCEKRCEFEVEDAVENAKYVAIVGSKEKSLKLLLKPGYRGVASFPKSGMVFPRITDAFFAEEILYFCHGKFISLLAFDNPHISKGLEQG